MIDYMAPKFRAAVVEEPHTALCNYERMLRGLRARADGGGGTLESVTRSVKGNLEARQRWSPDKKP